MKDYDAYTEYDWETGKHEKKTRPDNWYQYLSKIFAGGLFLGGIDYIAEEAGASVTSSIGVDTPGVMEEIQMDPIITSDNAQIHDIGSASADTIPMQSTVYENPAFEDITPVDDTVVFLNPHGETSVPVVEETVLWEPPVPDRAPMTSTPVGGARPKTVNFRFAYDRQPIDYGAEDFIAIERPGTLAKVRGDLGEFVELRDSGYFKTTNQIDRISAIEDETSFINYNYVPDVPPEEIPSFDYVVDKSPLNFTESRLIDNVPFRIRFRPGGLHVEEGGFGSEQWSVKPYTYGVGNYYDPPRAKRSVEPHVGPRPRPTPGPRPQPGPKPKPIPLPVIPIPDRLRPAKKRKDPNPLPDKPLHKKGHKSKHVKRHCIKKDKKGRCIKWKLRSSL